MDHDDEISNKSENRPFTEVLDAFASRRKFMSGSLAAAATGFIAPSIALADDDDDDDDDDDRRWRRRRGDDDDDDDDRDDDEWERRDCSIEFEPVSIEQATAGDGKTPVISTDYEYQVLIPWGTPLRPGIPPYEGDPNTRPSSADQTNMVGIGHDGMHFFPRRGSQRNRRGLLAINHEFGINFHVMAPSQRDSVLRRFKDPDDPSDKDDFRELPNSLEAVRLSQHAHGVSIIDLRKRNGTWDVVTRSWRNRRIHVNTPVMFSGPVAGSDLLDSDNPMLGTVNNCSSGPTPWGTYLTCEENFNGYFGDKTYGPGTKFGEEGGTWSPTPEQERYGFSARGFDYGWELEDPRFDLSQPDSVEETNRFGWVVEIDPDKPNARPVKRTALGRFKHEGATIAIGRGKRVVCYMGDDQRFDYIYKFVSADDYRKMLRRGISPLDEGRLYVARFDDDGTGEWLELTSDDPDIQAAGLTSQDEVLTYARLAADALGATPMDRPEWIALAPNKDVFCTLTNNSRRTEADAANPLAPNNDGHIIRWRDSNNHVGTSFTWDIFVIAQDTHADGDERTFSDPDGLWIDPCGRMFIQTDGGQKKGLQDQMLVTNSFDDGNPDASNLDIRRLFVGVNGDEITGVATTPNQRTMFINTQHPGNGDPTATNFPAATDGETIPRDCTFAITRKDKGIVGS